MNGFWTRVRMLGRGLLIGAFLLVSAGAAAYFAVKAPTAEHSPAPTKNEAARDAIKRIGENAIVVPESIAQNMSLKTAVVSDKVRPIPLPPLQGNLALDTNCLTRVHTRFAGEVASLGMRTDAPEANYSTQQASPQTRPLRVGDAVKKGELLAVVWSSGLGEKKSELVDAISKLRTDEATYKQLLDAYKDGGIPERSVREAERNVEMDKIAVVRAERTLSTWRLTEEEIAAVKREASELKGATKKIDPATWARVEVRSSQDGVILEKNVAVGDIVDTTADLFKIGEMSHLAVWAHAYEEDLAVLQALPKPIRWEVRLPSRSGVVFPGKLEQVGAVIDPNQHTALVSGRVENTTGDLKIGQAVTVAIEMTPPVGEIELPADAVIEDGRESVVFLLQDAKENRYIRTTVQVCRRYRDSVCIRSDRGIKPGDRVVTNSSLLLRDAMDQLPVPQK